MILLAASTMMLGVPQTLADTVSVPRDESALQVESWLRKSIPLIKTIKAGSSIADLNRLFMPAGGLVAPGKVATYVFKACPMIKIDVEFDTEKNAEMGRGTIVSVSRPYLDDMVAFD
ncbi:hypothetical protein QET40_11240 [Akkermansia sp. N21169]|nr:hypothetical protein [Akkermansia sp. N21169]MDH3069680.1 hypothetical protein [Akkermansia sp. N21169]